MVNDPYKVLEVDKNATKEEIKKAYYKVAKKYHPDLHPNDPVAAQKMTEANEAYDMLMNPDKYKNRTNPNTNQTQSNTYQHTYAQNQSYYQNNTNSDAYGFDFASFFGFQTRTIEIRVQNGDSDEIIKAINLIKAQRYQESLEILNDIISTYRNDRWYFITAYANYCYGNKELAFEQSKKAVELNPQNQDYQLFYRRLYQQMQQSSNQTIRPVSIFTIIFRLIAMYLFFQLLILLFQILFFRR